MNPIKVYYDIIIQYEIERLEKLIDVSLIFHHSNYSSNDRSF